MYLDNLSLILTATIDPKGMSYTVRANIEDRLNDYKKSFNFWINQDKVKKIIFIENSGYDISYFKELSKKSNKEIEIISSDFNNFFERKLGKGFGEYLNLKEIFEKSKIANKTNYFIVISGSRHIIKNFNKIFNDIEESNTDIYLNLKDNLKFADTQIFSGTKKFFENYLLPELSKVNDSVNNIFEYCAARATLKAIADGFSYSQIKIYPDIEGFGGSNGRKIKTNIFKKFRLFIFGRIKKYIFKSHRN
jgi:hypothetical protein